MASVTRRDTLKTGAAVLVLNALGVGGGRNAAAVPENSVRKGEAEMTHLYGRNFKAQELYDYVGRMEQVAGAQRFQLTEGKANGVRCARVYTGSGFEFLVVLDRAMDIALASYNGAALNWLSQSGIVAPEYYEPQGKGWDRSFFGGLNQTCGLRSAGHDSTVDGEEFGLHGRVSAIPAEDVNVTTEWRGDKYVIELKGHVRQAHAYAENLLLTRTITTEAGAKSFTQIDEVTNEGAKSSPHTIMYHINPGFPILTEKSELIWSLEKMEGDTPEKFAAFATPSKGGHGGGYAYHKLDADGIARAAVVNPELSGGDGLGMYIAYKTDTLPVMVTWKHMVKHAYLIGIEPANCRIATNAKLKSQGILPVLEPGESRVYEIEFGVLEGKGEIDAFRKALP